MSSSASRPVSSDSASAMTFLFMVPSLLLFSPRARRRSGCEWFSASVRFLRHPFATCRLLTHELLNVIEHGLAVRRQRALQRGGNQCFAGLLPAAQGQQRPASPDRTQAVGVQAPRDLRFPPRLIDPLLENQ